MKRFVIGTSISLILLILLAACGNQGDPAKSVEKYIQAKVAGDSNALRPLLCAAMEKDFDREVSSFASVQAKIEDMACTRDGNSDVVRCKGQISALYGTETTTFPLGAYKVVLEDGVWKWCGETS